MIGSFGWMELLLILFIVLIIFGAGKIPQLGEGLGKAIKGFKKSIHEPDAMDVTPQDETGMGNTPQATEQSAPGQTAPGQLAEPPVAQPVTQNVAPPAGEALQQQPGQQPGQQP